MILIVAYFLGHPVDYERICGI